MVAFSVVGFDTGTAADQALHRHSDPSEVSMLIQSEKESGSRAPSSWALNVSSSNLGTIP